MLKVSIIIPVYNAEKFIERCIDSVMAQDYDAIECILVDDGATDYSILRARERIRTYTGKKTFKTIFTERNSGASAARNLGIRHASGDYLYFLDSDDYLAADCIASLVELAVQYPGTDMILGDMKCENPVLDKAFTHRDKGFPSYTEDAAWLHRHMLTDVSVSPCNKLLRTGLIRGNELFFEEAIVNEDVLWMFFVSKYVTSFAFCAKQTYFYQYNPNSVTTSPEKEEERVRSWEGVLDLYLDHIDDGRKWIEHFALLKLFRHVKGHEISAQARTSFETEIDRRIVRAMGMAAALFRPMYRMLRSNGKFKGISELLWSKGLGLLYRLAQRQDRKPIHLVYWSEPNFGDALSPLLVEELSGRPASMKAAYIRPLRRFVKAILYVSAREMRSILFPWQSNVVGVGSVITCGNKRSKVWGSGFMSDHGHFRGGDVLAVRGPLTAAKLVAQGFPSCKVFGDPALLLPLWLPGAGKTSSRVGIVPHWKETGDFLADYGADYRVIDLRSRDVRQVVDQITSCEYILSTSLHGLVVAHAYGIPALWIKKGYIETDGFKFSDYFQSVGITPYEGFACIEEMLKGNQWEDFFRRYADQALPSVDLEQLQKALLSVAPFPLKRKYKQFIHTSTVHDPLYAAE